LFQNEQTLSTKDLEEDKNQVGPTLTYEKHDPLLHGPGRTRK